MDDVNMFTDSLFIKTSSLEYHSDINTAYFGYATDAWEHDNMLSADDGWYEFSSSKSKPGRVPVLKDAQNIRSGE